MKNRKETIKELVENYIKIRIDVYKAVKERNSPWFDSLKKAKGDTTNQIFNLMSDREYYVIKDKFLEIMGLLI